MKSIILVAVGGAAGAVFRHLISHAMKSSFPAYTASGTLIVNLVGSFLIGLLLGATPGQKSLSETWRLIFVTGFLGGLTTFSSLAHETVLLSLKENNGTVLSGLGHLSANIVLGLGAVWLGVLLRR